MYTYPRATCANRRRYELQEGPRIENERTYINDEVSNFFEDEEMQKEIHEVINIISKFSSRDSVTHSMFESLNVISVILGYVTLESTVRR